MRALQRLSVVALVLLAASACSGTSTRSTPQDDALVTAEQIMQAAPDSPAGVTLQLWRAVQVGDIPTAVSFYHERVRLVIGDESVAGTLSQLRSTVAVLKAEIISDNRTPMGVELVVRATSAGSSVGIHSFLLRREDDAWRVAYDTFLGDALPSYVEAQVQNRLAPQTNRRLPAAERAAIRVSALYRTLFLNQHPAPNSGPAGRSDGTP